MCQNLISLHWIKAFRKSATEEVDPTKHPKCPTPRDDAGHEQVQDHLRVDDDVQQNPEPEEVAASDFVEAGDWFEFRDGLGPVARIRAVRVERIDRI